MNKIKKYIVLLMMSILCINMSVPVAQAEDIALYISVSSSQVNVGDSITVTVSYSYSGSFAGDFTLSYSGPVSYAGGSIPSSGVISVMGNGSASATFTTTGEGTASFSVSGGAQDINTEADLGVPSQGASVAVVAPSAPSTPPPSTPSQEEPSTQAPTTEDNDNDSNTYLASLSINPGKLSPEFSPYTNEYKAQVDEDVTEISVSAAADDSNSVVSVWGEDDLKLGENLVQVAVTGEDGSVRYYDIYVMVGEDVGTPFTEVDGVKYRFIDYEDGLEQPEGFEKSTLKYEKWEVMAFEAPNKLFKIVPIVEEEAEDEEYGWFIYDEETNSFSPYKEYSSKYVRYVIKNTPSAVTVPEGFTETEITIDSQKIKAYQSANIADKKLYLVYAMNVSGGEGFYLFDMSEGSFMRYVPMIVEKEIIVEATPTEATPTVATPLTPVEPEEEFFTKEVLFYITCGAIILLIIFIIILCCVASKNKNIKDELEEAESMIAQLTGNQLAEEPVKEKKKKKDKKANKEKKPKKEKEPKKAKEPKESMMSDVDLFANTYAEPYADNYSEAVEISPQDKYMMGEEVEESVPSVEIPTVPTVPENYDANMDSAFADGNDN